MQRSTSKRALSSNSASSKIDSSSKRTKQIASQQTNTLFNYFASNKKTEIEETLVVKNEIKIESDLIKNEKIEIPNEIETKKEPIEKSSFLSIFKQVKTEQKKPIEPIVENYEATSSSKNKENVRKCPFYKRIEGTKIVVDAFSYGEIENANAYFLSHFHYDHFIGLNKHFKQTMYCSQITANLVIKQIKVEKSYIKVLEYNKFINVYDNSDNIQVCLIDANHCPGSVMFLFRINKSKYILHTGDFRASNELVEELLLKRIKLDIIYLDTTYLDSYYKFLPQSEIIKLGIGLVKKELASKPNALITCGSYTIGKERIFIGIAEALDLKIYVTREKKNIIDCLNDSALSKRITQNPNETNLHVIPMGKLNIKDLESYASKFEKFDYIIALKPSGWTHDECSTTDGLSIIKKTNNLTIYGLEYSEHSSFEELKNCIKSLKPRKVIPTVNIATQSKREKMQIFLNEWMI